MNAMVIAGGFVLDSDWYWRIFEGEATLGDRPGATAARDFLAPLAVFGLGCAMWRDLRVAAAGALLIGLTFEYPYYPQVWAGWPLARSSAAGRTGWPPGRDEES